MNGAIGRLLARPRERSEGYAFCSTDGFWFRPAYTDGTCPLCGEAAAGGAPTLPLLQRAERSWLGLAALTLESVVMLTLVLLMYFRA